MLTAFTTYMLLKSGSFPWDRPTWDGNPTEEQLWPAWKLFFKPLQLELEREYIVTTEKPDMFGTAALLQSYHAIVPAVPRVNTTGKIKVSSIMEQLNGHFNALASAATNSNAALDQLA